MASCLEQPHYNVQCPSSALPYQSASEWYAQYTTQLPNNTGAYKFVDSRIPCNMAQYMAQPSNNTGAYMVADNSRIPLAQLSNNTGAYIALAQDASITKIQPSFDALSESVTTLIPQVNYTVPKPMTASIAQESVRSYVQLQLEVSCGGLSQEIDKDTVQLVSLGCACGPKMAFKEMGLGAETLPFDWITTTSDGVLDFLRSGFQGFFEFERKVEKDVCGINITAFRSMHHSFWHDDPTLEETRAKYNRRFARMLAINAHSQPVLFVRLAATSEEIRTVDQFLGQLNFQFGPRAYLLLIIDLQGDDAPGPCTVKGLDNLLIHYLNGGSGVTKFCEPVDNALDWVASKPVRAMQVQDLAVAWNLAKPVTPGYYGMGGLPAFEGIPEMF